MAGPNLTLTSNLTCPHGATVTILPGTTRASASGAKSATMADRFVIVGCPFMLPTPVPTPSPCVRVQWLVGSVRVTAGGSPSLDRGSVGLCFSAAGLPQGPVVIQSTQASTQGV